VAAAAAASRVKQEIEKAEADPAEGRQDDRSSGAASGPRPTIEAMEQQNAGG